MEQVEQLQGLCEEVAGGRTRSDRVTIMIRNNMPRWYEVEVPFYDEDHVLLGYTTVLHRIKLPESELEKRRQRNRIREKQ